MLAKWPGNCARNVVVVVVQDKADVNKQKRAKTLARFGVGKSAVTTRRSDGDDLAASSLAVGRVAEETCESY